MVIAIRSSFGFRLGGCNTGNPQTHDNKFLRGDSVPAAAEPERFLLSKLESRFVWRRVLRFLMSNNRAVKYRRLALAESDPEKAKLLHQIADEADRRVLVTADWLTPASSWASRQRQDSVTMIRFLAIAVLTMVPAMAQGISNSRDVGGNIPRDKGASTPTIQPHAMVSSAVQSRPVQVIHVRKPR
jgi:hypothetical protein